MTELCICITSFLLAFVVPAWMLSRKRRPAKILKYFANGIDSIETGIEKFTKLSESGVKNIALVFSKKEGKYFIVDFVLYNKEKIVEALEIIVCNFPK